MEIYLNMDMGTPARRGATLCDQAWIDSVCADCARHGVKKLFWRVSLGQAYYHSKVLRPVDRHCGPRWHRVAEVLQRMDPLAVAVEKAHQYGIELWAWWPFSETHVARGDLNLIDPFYAKRIDLFWCNSDGSRFFLGHPCLAEPEVLNRYKLMAQELSDYKVDGILMCTRSHCTVPGESGRGLVDCDQDEFGFNRPIVEEFSRRYGVDITKEDFDTEAWHRLKGEYLSKLWDIVSNVLKDRGQQLWVNISPDRCRFMANRRDARDSVRMYKDWKSWIDNKSVDGIVAVTPRNSIEEPVDMTDLKAEVPAEKICCWLTCLDGRPASECRGDLRLENMEGKSSQDYFQRFTNAKNKGVYSILGHEMYAVLFTNWAEGDIGLFPESPEKYWSAIEKVQGNE